jgi:5'-methylthioadenosine phosphorylase
VSGTPEAVLGIVGGSGLYAMEGVDVLYERSVETPFGDPSDAYVVAEVDGTRVAFLSRHGRGHRLLPTEINYRANVFGFKVLGVETIFSVSAVGSMKEEYAPTHIVFPDQFIDRTRTRADTFFGNGLAAHVSMAHPVCAEVAAAGVESAREAGATVHSGGAYVCIEGPQFSTLAESRLYRSWGVDVIGMTNLTEAKLAREAEICYATMAMVTDYDCWHEEEENVTVETVLGYLRRNSAMAQRILRSVAGRLGRRTRACSCHEALRYALITERAKIPPDIKVDLAPLVEKYL